LTGGPDAVQRLMAEVPATVSLVLALVVWHSRHRRVRLFSQIVVRRTREIGSMSRSARCRDVRDDGNRKTLRTVAWGASLRPGRRAGDLDDAPFDDRDTGLPDSRTGLARSIRGIRGVIVALGMVVLTAS